MVMGSAILQRVSDAAIATMIADAAAVCIVITMMALLMTRAARHVDQQTDLKSAHAFQIVSARPAMSVMGVIASSARSWTRTRDVHANLAMSASNLIYV